DLHLLLADGFSGERGQSPRLERSVSQLRTVKNFGEVFALMILWVVASPCVSRGDETKQPLRFDFESVVARARALAAAAYQPVPEVPAAARAISYDQWRSIRFLKDRALWANDGLRFTVEFFHPGGLFTRPVAINVVDPSGVHPVTFSHAMFDYG